MMNDVAFIKYVCIGGILSAIGVGIVFGPAAGIITAGLILMFLGLVL